MHQLKTFSKFVMLFVSLPAWAASQSAEDLIPVCAPHTDPALMRSIVETESGFNPYAVGVTGGLVPQPSEPGAAVRTLRRLEAEGKNYSAGLAQISRSNFPRFGFTPETVFSPCENLRAGEAVLSECYARTPDSDAEPVRLKKALSCYNTGSFTRGAAYAERVLARAGRSVPDGRVPETSPPEPRDPSLVF